MAAAAVQTGNRAADSADAREIFPAFRTTIEEPPRSRMRRKRQGVTARFISQTEIAAGLAPFGTVRRNATALRARMRDEMRKLMTQGAIDFSTAVLAEARIQRNELIPKVRAPGCAAKPRIPCYSHEWNKRLRTDEA